MFQHVVVAGIGALGSELVQRLGRQGCKSVFLADADVLENKNIQASPFWSGGTTGQSKIAHSCRQLRSTFPNTKWHGAPVEIADVEPEYFKNADLIYSCVDTDLARMEIALIAAHYGLPVCDAGLGGTSTGVGRVSWFPRHNSAACFSCLLSSSRRATLLSIWESDVNACWTGAPDGSNGWTSTPTMASLIATKQVSLATSVIEDDELAFSLQLDLDKADTTQTITHKRSAECPFHDELQAPLFPICTRADCKACGNVFQPMRRIGWVKRWGSCTACGDCRLLIRKGISNHSVSDAA